MQKNTTKILRKCRILLSGNRLLGGLIYFVDTKGRHAIKFSFKTKVGQLSVWQQKTNSEEKTLLEGTNEEAVSLDVSYKFEDSLLEIKNEIPGREPHRRFIKLPLPMETFLFSLRVRNWKTLPTVSLNKML